LAKNEWPGYWISEPILSWGSLSRQPYMIRHIPTPEDPKKDYILKPTTNLHEIGVTP